MGRLRICLLLCFAGCGPAVAVAVDEPSTSSGAGSSSDGTSSDATSSAGPPATTGGVGSSTSSTSAEATSTGAAETETTREGSSTETGDEPSGTQVDPIDHADPALDLVLVSAYVTDELVSLRMEFAAAPFVGEADPHQTAYWYLDIDRDPSTGEEWLGTEVILAVHGYGGSFYATVNASPVVSGVGLCSSTTTVRNLGVELQFPPDAVGISGPFDAFVLSFPFGIPDVDYAPGKGHFTSAELVTLPPSVGAICE